MDPMEAVNFVTSTLVQWYNNFFRNLYHMWDGMTLIKYIRMIAVVGAYLLLRPYLEKLGAKIQAKEHEKEIDAYDIATADGEGKGKISPNMLRGAGGKVVELPAEDSESEEETTGADVKWGKKARKRQRATVKKLLEDQERLRMEEDGDEDDRDIMEHLVDYEPGKDGW